MNAPDSPDWRGNAGTLCTEVRDMTNTHRTASPLRFALSCVQALLIGAITGLLLMLIPTHEATAATPPALCGTDAECAAMFPGVQGYGVAPSTPVADCTGAVAIRWEDGSVSYMNGSGSDAETGECRLSSLPAGLVIDVHGGTATVLSDGSFALCRDWTTTPGKECSGTEFLPVS